jgi:hypothetical protein
MLMLIVFDFFICLLLCFCHRSLGCFVFSRFNTSSSIVSVCVCVVLARGLQRRRSENNLSASCSRRECAATAAMGGKSKQKQLHENLLNVFFSACRFSSCLSTQSGERMNTRFVFIDKHLQFLVEFNSHSRERESHRGSFTDFVVGRAGGRRRNFMMLVKIPLSALTRNKKECNSHSFHILLIASTCDQLECEFLLNFFGCSFNCRSFAMSLCLECALSKDHLESCRRLVTHTCAVDCSFSSAQMSSFASISRQLLFCHLHASTSCNCK